MGPGKTYNVRYGVYRWYGMLNHSGTLKLNGLQDYTHLCVCTNRTKCGACTGLYLACMPVKSYESSSKGMRKVFKTMQSDKDFQREPSAQRMTLRPQRCCKTP